MTCLLFAMVKFEWWIMDVWNGNSWCRWCIWGHITERCRSWWWCRGCDL